MTGLATAAAVAGPLAVIGVSGLELVARTATRPVTRLAAAPGESHDGMPRRDRRAPISAMLWPGLWSTTVPRQVIAVGLKRVADGLARGGPSLRALTVLLPDESLAGVGPGFRRLTETGEVPEPGSLACVLIALARPGGAAIGGIWAVGNGCEAGRAGQPIRPFMPPMRFIIFIRPPPFIFFIMPCICSNWLSRRFTS